MRIVGDRHLVGSLPHLFAKARIGKQLGDMSQQRQLRVFAGKQQSDYQINRLVVRSIEGHSIPQMKEDDNGMAQPGRRASAVQGFLGPSSQPPPSGPNPSSTNSRSCDRSVFA